ncbi:MAG TPA: hypothetical protein VG826_33610 [Pirellulales bacterium]|nr:hypothetical protein [Pirellulales bacterium]
MARRIRQETEAIGSDSFLDVVTNTVGILIVLVMVVGIRAKNSPVDLPTEDADAKKAVGQLSEEAEGIEQDMLRLEGLVQEVTLSAQAKYQERGTLAYLLAEHERELDEAKKSLSTENQTAFEIRRALEAAESDLKKLENAKADVEKPKKRTPIKINSYPTPISRTVYGQEVHFQLRNGRLAWAPLMEMKELCEIDAKSKIERLRTMSEMSDMVGPRQGFEARYVLERLDDAAEAGTVPLAFSFELIPVSKELGEKVDDALEPTSRFRAKLSECPPRQCTVTLWTYGDSFAEYARVKELLYGMGYHVAARPLPDDINIGASNFGSHSSAQ